MKGHGGQDKLEAKAEKGGAQQWQRAKMGSHTVLGA